MYLYIFHNQDKFFSDEISLNASERKLHGLLKAYQNKAMVEDNPVGQCNSSVSQIPVCTAVSRSDE